MSHIIEPKEYLGKTLIYHFIVEEAKFTLRRFEQFRSSKWLSFQDWMEIYNYLENTLDNCQERNLKDLKAGDIIVSDYILLKITKSSLKSAYKDILGIVDSKKLFPVVLKIKISKVDASSLMKRLDQLEKKNVKNGSLKDTDNNHEYDPLQEAKTVLSDVVPYKASSKLRNPLESSVDSDFLEGNQAYSPKPLDNSDSSPEKPFDTALDVPKYKPTKISSKDKDAKSSRTRNPTASSSSRSSRSSKRIKTKLQEDLFGSEDSEGKEEPDWLTSTSGTTKSAAEPIDSVEPKRKKSEHIDEKLGKESGWLSTKRDRNSKPVKKMEPAKDRFKDEIECIDVNQENVNIVGSIMDDMNKQFPSTERPPIDKVLRLDHYSIDELLSTFSSYKSKLDELFQNYKRSKCPPLPKALSVAYMNATSAISTDKQVQMLQFLDKEYEIKLRDGPFVLTDLFMRQILPEWLILLFEKEHQLSREDCVRQLKYQN